MAESPAHLARERAAAARRRRRRLKENLTGWLFASPWVFGLLAFTVGPMAASIYLGMTRYDVIQPPAWVGLRNYVEILTEDPLTWQSLRFTTLYAVLSVSINLVAGLLLAVLLNQRIKWMPLWRTLYYMPTLLSGVVVALLCPRACPAWFRRWLHFCGTARLRSPRGGAPGQ